MSPSEPTRTTFVGADESEASKEEPHINLGTRRSPRADSLTATPAAADVESGEEMTSTTFSSVLPFSPIILGEELLAESPHDSGQNVVPTAVESPTSREFETYITPLFVPSAEVWIYVLSST